MVVGIDVGGTNTDAAIVKDDITTIKLPNEQGIEGVLAVISKKVNLKDEKVIVSTSLPLNLVLSKFDEISTLTLLVPGPGLDYSSYGVILRGAVNHRGDVVEDVDVAEIQKILSGLQAENVAIAVKFSVRNPKLEHDIFRLAESYYGETRIALSHHVGGMNYPLRINTTVLNAKIMETVHNLTSNIRAMAGDFFYYKGDGGIIPFSIALRNPSELYNSSSAAVAIGAHYLSRKKDALVVDFGGTTTDFVMLKDGKPEIDESAIIVGKKTLVRCVKSANIPYGGDSPIVDGGLIKGRKDNSLAFGGRYFTITDALNCMGCEIGDYRASRNYPEEFELPLQTYLEMVAEIIKNSRAERVIGTGYLARYMADVLHDTFGIRMEVPLYAESANAIGVAVSRISLTLYARYDFENRKVVYNGEIEGVETLSRNADDEEIIAMAEEKLRTMAMQYGADEEDVKDVRILYFNSFDVVRGGIMRGRIADVVIQIEPGIRSDIEVVV
jgi:hypothetical protein